MVMKKQYIIPEAEYTLFDIQQQLASNSLEVHGGSSDPLVDDSKHVFSRSDRSDAWKDENLEE